MSTETTLLLVKPDGVQRGLAGTIIQRFEQSGLKLVGMKLMHVSEELARRHYAEHTDRPFFGGLVSFITSSPVVALAVSGNNAIAKARSLMGATNPLDATPGTIRADLGVDIGRNLVHGSATADDAARELKIFFSSDELVSYERAQESWISE